MEKERKIKVLSLVALIVAVLGLTVAFAALSQTLTINGTASVNAAEWDVHFEGANDAGDILISNNLNNQSIVDFREGAQEASFSADKKTIEYFGVVAMPGDFVTYEFKIVNNGTVDAKIDNLNYKTPTYGYIGGGYCNSEEGTPDEGTHCVNGFPYPLLDKELSEKQLNLINQYYTVKLYYKDSNEEVKQNDVIKAGDSKQVILKCSYDISAPSSLTNQEEEMIILSAGEALTITYVQN